MWKKGRGLNTFRMHCIPIYKSIVNTTKTIYKEDTSFSLLFFMSMYCTLLLLKVRLVETTCNMYFCVRSEIYMCWCVIWCVVSTNYFAIVMYIHSQISWSYRHFCTLVAHGVNNVAPVIISIKMLNSITVPGKRIHLCKSVSIIEHLLNPPNTRETVTFQHTTNQLLPLRRQHCILSVQNNKMVFSYEKVFFKWDRS